jgi:hypothetical protein
MDGTTATVSELAVELGVTAKTMRGWMRRQGWRHPVELGSPWTLTAEQVEQLHMHFSRSRSTVAPASTDDDPGFGALTVGELLTTYSRVLAELRLRNVVRTNNAPIGDLAEYCAASVYDGLLAPNSEKSYDLIAADGSKIQVKVRLIRTGTSPAAVFSPIRSFEFDACLFLLIDNERSLVLAAREWTTHQVREHGRHRTHTNGTVVRVAQVRAATAIGVDRTGEFDVTWQAMLAQCR